MLSEAKHLTVLSTRADALTSRCFTEPALSIVENGPERFEGRKLGILVSDGSDAGILKALKAALDKAGASYEIIAPKVTGAEASDGSWIDADQMIDGGPSVLYDAVALLLAAEAMADLLLEPSARDFVADAFAKPPATASTISSRVSPCSVCNSGANRTSA